MNIFQLKRNRIGDSRLLNPFHLRQIQLVAGEALDGGEEEFVVAEFAGDSVQEGEFGLAVVAGATVEGDGFLDVVLVVPAASTIPLTLLKFSFMVQTCPPLSSN